MGQIAGSPVPGTFTTRDFSTDPANALTRDQTRHVFKKTCGFDLAIGGTPATREEIVHVAEAAGTVLEFGAGANNTGTATVALSFDLKKNGSSILSSAVAVAHTDADRAVVTGTINSASYSAGDVFSILLTATTPNDSTGPFARVSFDELVTA